MQFLNIYTIIKKGLLLPNTGSIVIIHAGLNMKEEIVDSHMNQWLTMDEFEVHVLNRYCSRLF